MAVISTSDLRNGITLKIDEGLFTVLEFQHVKPGKGGAFVRTKLRNARTGAVIERTYRGDERLEQAIIDKRDTQYLYRDGDDYIFMDQSNFDQVPVSSKNLGEATNFLVETGKAMLISYDDEIIGVELPASVELTITETEPGVQGDRVSGARKPALCRSG
jgi:elongation factor P